MEGNPRYWEEVESACHPAGEHSRDIQPHYGSHEEWFGLGLPVSSPPLLSHYIFAMKQKTITPLEAECFSFTPSPLGSLLGHQPGLIEKKKKKNNHALVLFVAESLSPGQCRVQT